MTEQQQIQAGYDQMWDVGKTDLLQGTIDVDQVPDSTSKRWGISAVLRLPISLGESLMEWSHQLRSLTGEGHTFYDPTTFHVTLRSIEFFRHDVGEHDQAVATYTQLLNQVASSFSELTIQFSGLSANRVGIILQGFPPTDQLQRLRQRFHELLEQHQLLTGPEWQQPRLNAHASLVVFGAPMLLDKEALVSYIDTHRSTQYGEFSTSMIDIVRYERRLDSVSIVTLEQIALGKP